MQVTAIDLLAYADRLERLQASNWSDHEKRLVAQDILKSFPQPAYCVHNIETRLIVARKYEDYINGFTTKEAQSEKPKQKRVRKTPTKSPKA